MELQSATINNIKKRDGSLAPFEPEKITNAIFKAAQSVGGNDRQTSELLTESIVQQLQSQFPDKTPTVEDVQDLIENVLIKEGHAKTAKAFILYRQKRIDARQSGEKKEIESEEARQLKEHGVYLSQQAEHILNTSTQLDELGRAIFLDRYSIKTKREDVQKGDLVIVITKEDFKYPKKDLGIVLEIDDDEQVTCHMITGQYADKENGFRFTQSLYKIDKPMESVQDAYRRVGRAVASAEQSQELREQWEEKFSENLLKNHIQPAGRIMTGANVDAHGRYTSNLTLYNCYVIPCPKDSRGGIIETLNQMIEIMSRGGGVGISLASLRPRYSYVQGVHGKSSGSVSWGGLYSYATALIEQGGSRRGALMLMQGDWHPDVLEFIESKRKKGMIENANISVMVSDDFMKAVKENGTWDLIYPDYEDPKVREIYDREWDGNIYAWKEKGYPTKVYQTVNAREMWEQIIQSAWASAEPGVVFMERYNKMSNSWYFNPVICTNPCGEQGLPGWGVCNLGHLYLASFAKKIGEDETGPLYEMDWDQLRESAQVLARFLDNVIDLTPYHFEENEKNQKSERRVGGGTLGLGELLIRLRLKYGSDESVEFIDKVYKTIAEEMYKTSADIAEEKGAFPKFDAEKFLQSGFMQQMPEEIRETVRQKGIRNVTLTTQAPTGTVGSMLGTSTGIEPYFAFEYYRQSRLGFHKVLLPFAEEYATNMDELPDFFVSSMQMSPMDHIKVQAAVQKWTDSSISKTANCPADFTVEQTMELYEKAYDLGCKGVTIYRDGSRYEQVLSTDENMEEKNAASSAGEDTKTYGAEVGNYCPQCKEGVMVKIGGCTECDKQCGFKGGCDMK